MYCRGLHGLNSLECLPKGYIVRLHLRWLRVFPCCLETIVALLLKDLTVQKISPKMYPDNSQDLLVALLVGIFQIAILFGLPGFIVYWLSGSTVLAWAIMISLYVLFLSFSVFSLSLDDKGIKFHRLFGIPKNLTWDEIVKIEHVSPRELVVKGWLWPLFPAKEMTACFSTRGHFKITYQGGFCFYPPKDVETFTALIRQSKPSALSQN